MSILQYQPLPLTELAARRLAIIFFMEPTILSSISNARDIFTPHITNQEVWYDILEVKLPDKISKLRLPDCLKELLKDMVEPMGRQVRDWKLSHEKYLEDSDGEKVYFDVYVLENMYWTSAGTVDYLKTAEELIHSYVINHVNKYKLACLYCMDENVRTFWRELPDETKSYFCSNEGRYLESGGMGQEFWWPYIIRGEESELDNITRSYRRDEDTFHTYAFHCSVKKGNKTAAGFFFQKLTPEEKEASLENAAEVIIERYSNNNYQDMVFPKEKCSELLMYLLSLMTPEKKKQIFQGKPIDVLAWFLAWPLRHMLWLCAESIWGFLSHEDRETFFCILCENFSDFDTHLVRAYLEFFLCLLPDSARSFVDRQCDSGSYFLDILNQENIEALEIFFRCLDAASGKRLVFSEHASKKLKEFLSKRHFEVVEVCFREASLSQDDRKKLRKSWSITEMKSKTRNYARLFYLQDETN